MSPIVRSDARILRVIRDTLAWDVRLDDFNVDVDVANGVTTLTGNVRTYSEKMVVNGTTFYFALPVA